MLKVLLVNKLSDPVVGGVETVARQIAAALGSDSQFKVTILAGNEQAFKGSSRYIQNNVQVIKAASFGLVYHTALSFQYPFLLHKLIREHDIIHFHTPNPLGEISFFLNKIPAQKKVIVTVHADISQTGKKLFNRPYHFFLERLLQRADVVTTMAPQNLVNFPCLQPFLHKCTVIPNAYDARHIADVTEKDKTGFLKKYQLDGRQRTVLFAGRLTRDKGLAYLLEAISTLPGVQLIIAGDGKLKTELQKQAAALPNKIVFTGFISGRNMATAYKVADVFVLPSVKETFGIVQAEAMYFGLPVINTSLDTGVNFVSVHNETGLTVPPADVPALANAIRRILNDPSLQERFAANALKRAKLFTPEKMTGAFKAVYSGNAILLMTGISPTFF